MQANEIKQLRSPKLLNLFAIYLEYYFKKNFNAVRVSYEEQLDIYNRPIIIYTNHASWWDPLVFMLLDKHLFKDRVSYGPMDHMALNNYSFMRRLGIFGVANDSFKGLRDFINVSLDLLKQSDTILWVTAQGEFSDPRQRPLNLKPGIAHLVKNQPNVLLLPIAFEFPFWQERHPEALIRVGCMIEAKTLQDKKPLEINQILEQKLSNIMDDLSGLAQCQQVNQFELLFSGETGAGMIYNTFNNIKAKLKGHTFHSKHSEIGHDRKSIDT